MATPLCVWLDGSWLDVLSIEVSDHIFYDIIEDELNIKLIFSDGVVLKKLSGRSRLILF